MLGLVQHYTEFLYFKEELGCVEELQSNLLPHLCTFPDVCIKYFG